MRVKRITNETPNWTSWYRRYWRIRSLQKWLSWMRIWLQWWQPAFREKELQGRVWEWFSVYGDTQHPSLWLSLFWNKSTSPCMCCWYNLGGDKLKIEIMTVRMVTGLSGKGKCVGFILAALQVLSKATLSLPSSAGWGRENRTKGLGQGKDRKRSLTGDHHGPNKLDLEKLAQSSQKPHLPPKPCCANPME